MPIGLRGASRITECSVFYLNPTLVPRNINELRSMLETMRSPIELPEDVDELGGFSPPFYLTFEDKDEDGDSGDEQKKRPKPNSKDEMDFFSAPLVQQIGNWLVFQYTFQARSINTARNKRIERYEIRKKVEELGRKLEEEEAAAISASVLERSRATAEIKSKSFVCALDTHNGVFCLGYVCSNPKKPNNIIQDCVQKLAYAIGYSPVRVIHRENTTTLTAWLAEPGMHLPETLDLHNSARLKNKKTEAQAALTNQDMDTSEIDELLKHAKVVEEIGMELVGRGYCSITKYGDLKKIRENANNTEEMGSDEDMPADEYWTIEMMDQLQLIFAMIDEIVFLHTPCDLSDYSNPSAEHAVEFLKTSVSDEESTDIDPGGSDSPSRKKSKSKGSKPANKKPPADDDDMTIDGSDHSATDSDDAGAGSSGIEEIDSGLDISEDADQEAEEEDIII